MLNMRIDSLVAALVRQELYGKGKNDQALHFHFDLGLSSYTNDFTFDERRGLHLLYQVNEGYTYINVFSAVTDSPFSKVKEIKEWKHEVTHDSCWRDIGVFSATYFDMAKKINEKRVSKGLKEIAPAAMSEHNSVPVFNGMYDWVPVKVSKDLEDDRNYRRLVEVL